MNRVDELRQAVIRCFRTSPGPAYLNEYTQAVRDEALNGERPCNWHHADIPCKGRMELQWVCECCGHRESVRTQSMAEDDEK